MQKTILPVVPEVLNIYYRQLPEINKKPHVAIFNVKLFLEEGDV